jgi:pimeloyl-ACP methyl ester carboxylesterase
LKTDEYKSRPTDVLLVHGMGRSPFSMAPLARRLRREGLRTHFFGYQAARDPFQKIAGQLRNFLDQHTQKKLIVIGHSLGGLLLRVAIAEQAPEARPLQLFQLGSPNHSPQLARFFQKRFLFRILNGDPGQRLCDIDWMNALPGVTIPTVAIAGTAGMRANWWPIGHEPNDGIVTVREASLEKATVIELPVRHTFMMNYKIVAETIIANLNKGFSDPV